MSNFSVEEYNLDEDEEHRSLEQKILIHLDIDYFFAQVEILKDPELKDKAVIVGHTAARKDGRGVVLTCNYETRKYGVHSGMAMKVALEKCPQAVIVKSNYSDYKEISNTIMDYLKGYEVPMRQAGIDEVYMDISSLVDNYLDAEQLSATMKTDILELVNLTVSIGIGPTLKIAKIGSDYKKPDGITVISPDRLDEIFRGLPLIRIPGIGKKTFQRLQAKGLHTCDQIMNLSKVELTDILGSWGEYFHRIVHAETANSIQPRGQRKSVSHSRTFVGDPGDLKKSREYMDKLFNMSFDSLIEEEFTTKTVNVTIRFNGFNTITRAKSLSHHTKDRRTLYQITTELIEPHLADPRGIRLLGVGFSNLKKKDEQQLSLEKFTPSTRPEEASIPDISALLPRSEKKKKGKDPSLADFF